MIWFSKHELRTKWVSTFLLLLPCVLEAGRLNTGCIIKSVSLLWYDCYVLFIEGTVSFSFGIALLLYNRLTSCKRKKSLSSANYLSYRLQPGITPDRSGNNLSQRLGRTTIETSSHRPVLLYRIFSASASEWASANLRPLGMSLG